MELNYITRGNVKIHSVEMKEDCNYKSQQKVYYCCYKDEHELYLKQTAEEILRIVDCAIFYDKNPRKEKNEEWKELLLDMNLLVVIVTQKFLKGENQAQKEFLYALKKGIPVLPILKDEKLINPFNKIANGIQVLMADEFVDETQISYQHKLETFLCDLLTDNKLINRIHDVSDGSVFLSYRKKDRKHLLELINAIRDDDRCIDIPIWYDEFLVAGEKFEGQIVEKLSSGKAFVLTVTPNLVNESNYVQEKEYPKAQEEKKQILPVEMVNTDKNLLAVLYPGIPQCVEREEKEIITDFLSNVFCEKRVSDEVSDLEKEFLVGVGFLTGTDREKNVTLAQKKITNAAHAGHIEAIEKLVSIYEHGDGVGYDLDKAIEWQERLIQIFKDEEINQTYDSKRDIIDRRFKLGELYEKREQCIEKAKSIYKEILVQARDNNLKYDKLIAQLKLNQLEKKERFEKMSEELRIEWKKEMEEQKDIEGFIDLAHKYEDLGAINEARMAYEVVINLLQGGAEIYSRVISKEKVIQVFYRAANIYRQLGEYELAKNYLTCAYEAAEEGKVWSDERDAKVKMDELCRTLSDFYRESERDVNGYSESLKWINKAIKYSKGLAMDNTTDYAITHIENLRRKGGLLELLKNYSAAAKSYKTAMTECQNINEKDVEVRLEQASIYDDIGDIWLEQMKIKKDEVCGKNSLDNYEQALKIREDLKNEENLSSEERERIYNALTISYDNLGRLGIYDIDKKRGRKNACIYYKKNVELCEELHESNGYNLEIKYNLFYSYIRVAEVNIILDGDKNEAREYFVKARDFLKKEGMNKQKELVHALERIDQYFYK